MWSKLISSSYLSQLFGLDLEDCMNANTRNMVVVLSERVNWGSIFQQDNLNSDKILGKVESLAINICNTTRIKGLNSTIRSVHVK
ncbi:hypothetical protein ES332_D11G135700v1 [Gossypium tomentosum]|uniref:Uncharacterized protein n=1 Tax=Gossypium tomentosum TaxID=34277 RepID=A0A5D2IMV8_GOSTO|nr:hypothetical protein ES332_D11G135700v1 [Gossypium tomentosum]